MVFRSLIFPVKDSSPYARYQKVSILNVRFGTLIVLDFG